MGYNYKIILEENREGNWYLVEYYSNSGSFSCEVNHFFLMKKNEATYQEEDDDGYYWYTFTPEQVLEEYKPIDWRIKMKEIIDSSENPEDAIYKIKDIDYSYPTYWDELEKWAKLILSYPEKILRIRYGIAV